MTNSIIKNQKSALEMAIRPSKENLINKDLHFGCQYGTQKYSFLWLWGVSQNGNLTQWYEACLKGFGEPKRPPELLKSMVLGGWREVTKVEHPKDRGLLIELPSDSLVAP